MDQQKFFEIQNTIRNNTESIRNFASELNSFVSDIDKKDDKIKKTKTNNFDTDKLPPVRNRIDISDRLTEDQKIEQQLKKNKESEKKA